MNHAVRTVLVEQAPNQWTVTDIAVDEDVPFRVQTGQRLAIAGVGQQIDIDHRMTGSFKQVADEVGADETGATGY